MALLLLLLLLLLVSLLSCLALSDCSMESIFGGIGCGNRLSELLFLLLLLHSPMPENDIIVVSCGSASTLLNSGGGSLTTLQ